MTDYELNEWMTHLAVKGTKEQKHKLATFVLSDLFKAITLADLESSFQSLSVEERQQLQEDAKVLQKMRLWHWLHKEMVTSAERKLYFECESPEDMIFPKAALYMEDVRQKKVNNLAAMK